MCKSDARLDGQVAVVTGGGSGMGYEAAKDLASRGARVIIASRNATKLQHARDEIRETTGNQNVDYRVFDLASLQSVRNLAQEITHEHRLDMLVNNAGEIGLPDIHTEDGLSLMMQVNFFGPFLLTYLLFPMLKSSAPSRIVNTAAITMYLGNIDFDHWNDLDRYNVFTASGNAKLSVFLITAEWDRRLKGTGITANTLDPFITKDTDIARRVFGQISRYLNENVQHLWKSDHWQYLWNVFYYLIGLDPRETGKEIAYYASAPELTYVSGEHFSFCSKLPRHWILKDMKLRKKLWKEAKKNVKIAPEEDWEYSLLH